MSRNYECTLTVGKTEIAISYTEAQQLYEALRPFATRTPFSAHTYNLRLLDRFGFNVNPEGGPIHVDVQRVP